MPNVPQDVPVANDKPQPMANMIAGRNALKPPAELLTSCSTNCFAPSESVIAFRLHAKVRISTAGTIALKPSGMHSIRCLKEISLRSMK